MPATREVVVLGGVRTPVGNYGGGLTDFSPSQLGATVIREAGVNGSSLSQRCIRNLMKSAACSGDGCDRDIPTIERQDAVAVAQSLAPGPLMQPMCLAHRNFRELNVKSRQHLRGAPR